jgi:lipopolysaccharide export LptBFGC system permease protein LptF
MKIWQRLLFGRLLSVFLFILSSLFVIFLFIDLSVHNLKFRQGGYGIQDISLYYVHSFSSLIDLFVPFAFLLACLKVLSDLTANLEILSLQMARLSLKKILMPFFLVAALLSALSLSNHEWIAPKSIVFLKKFKLSHAAKQQELRGKKILNTWLEDGSVLVYHSLDLKKMEAKDLFWIRTSNDIWHMKTLFFANTPPVADFADHFTLSAGGVLSKSESFEQKIFPEIRLTKGLTPTIVSPPESKALSTLFNERGNSAIIRTYLHHKLAMPLLPFLVLFAVAPLTLVHTRNRRLFLTVCLSILVFIIVMIFCDTLLLLSANELIEPWIAMWTVPISIFLLSIRKFARI